MTLYMLDTNTASAAIKGFPQIDLRLQQIGTAGWCISAVTYSELCFGLALKPEAFNLARLVNAFLQLASTEAWSKTAALKHGQIRAQVRQVGTPIGDFDEMIAAHALALNATLVTDNIKHFERVPGLNLENWLL
jgi:tRNA(fMet)-specific endonuclease VapC